MRIAELPWQADPARRFARLADRPWAVLLDSCRDRGAQGRYDIYAADPWLTLECRGREAVITRRGEREVVRGDPFKLLRSLLKPLVPSETDLPFSGGAIGYFAYELGRGCVDLGAAARPFPGYPEMAVGLYDWAVVSDHEQRRCRLVAQERDPQTARRWNGLLELLAAEAPAPAAPDYRVLAPPRSNFTRAEYRRAFRAVRDYIRAGDCYQVNLAQRWAAPSEGSLWAAYLRSRRDNPAPFSGYFRHPRAEIASASPERFLRVRDGAVETRPIKGTLRRGPGGDEAARARLAASAKDRAENLMIVDLLRNDLGKNCAPGTVRAPELFRVESFATVHHLVSTVTGRLRAGRDALGLLAGCFPGGSITGAPKRRAMQIIEELEPEPRGVYCGSLAYLGCDGGMDSSIAIRTLVQADGETSLHAGGGLVHDSAEAAEYAECADKARALLAVLEAFRN